ncbi:CMP-N-acetylneuraminate-beta-galactosamide-alpha-2,3-sialyltransferase 1-like isoform X3 [Paramisgurnus dabryanus]|uniref:CMP-N-acetylneuraminate-beta-galactosamide- alpha-2,3-sialyltransferase 1-like isoform X3 n=1 Tax=Paramisgurnus dabryanus TaxID=90735 RepID=UPI0031F35855
MIASNKVSLYVKAFFITVVFSIISLFMFLQHAAIIVEDSRLCACDRCVRDLKDDDWFLKRFNPTIQTMMNKNNRMLKKDVYRWWKGLQPISSKQAFEDVVDTLFELFPDEDHYVETNLYRCRTCAVVGNSGNLLKSHYGELIDNHDFVLRTYKQVQSTVDADIDRVMIVHPAFIKYVYDSWAEKHGRYPSTGFLTLILALHICDKVDVFGFGAQSNGRWHHYFDKSLNHFSRGMHGGDFENETMHELLLRNKICMYKGL